MALVFGWAMAEAVALPVMPDAVLAPLAAYHYREWRGLALAASFGSGLGAGISYALGRSPWGCALLDGLPLIRPAMARQAHSRLAREGPIGIRHQPFSTLPLKVYAVHAGRLRLPLGPFLVAVGLARAARLLPVGGLAALVGQRLGGLLWRCPPATLLVWSALFALGLWQAVKRWEQHGPPAPEPPAPEGPIPGG
jgi:membrane protein YqaA with SNARE-associated domain